MWRSIFLEVIYIYIYIYIYVDKYHGSNPIDIYRYISRHSIVDKLNITAMILYMLHLYICIPPTVHCIFLYM